MHWHDYPVGGTFHAPAVTGIQVSWAEGLSPLALLDVASVVLSKVMYYSFIPIPTLLPLSIVCKSIHCEKPRR